MIGIFQAYTVTLDRLYKFVNGTVLSDDVLFQLCGHILQAYTFSLDNALNRNTGHHRHYIGNGSLVHFLTAFGIVLLPCALHLVELMLQIGLTITE